VSLDFERAAEDAFMAQAWVTGTSAAGTMTRNRAPTRPVCILVGGAALVLSGTSGSSPMLSRECYYSSDAQPTNSSSFWPQKIPATSARRAEPDAQSVERTRASVHELRKLSGLTWEEMARLFRVARRSLHFWASGKPLSAAHEERLQRLLIVLRRIDRGSATRNRAALMEAIEGVLPVDLLVAGQYEEAVQLLGETGTRRRAPLRPLSAEAQEARRPLPPETLIGALQDDFQGEQRHGGKVVTRAVRAARIARK
jgi:transcriptional regulator with XRE-family HTH domain